MRVVGREAGLLSYLLFAMFAVTATTMPSLHPLLQVLGRGEAPNRGCRPGVWIWMREDRSRPGLVRLGGRDGGLVMLGIFRGGAWRLPRMPKAHGVLSSHN